MAWNWSAAAWPGAVELDVDWNCHSSIGIGWRGMAASLQPMELEWRGVNSGKISGLALDCTIPTAIPLAWRGVTLNTILELGRNCAIPKQFLERERGVTYRVVRLRGLGRSCRTSVFAEAPAGSLERATRRDGSQG